MSSTLQTRTKRKLDDTDEAIGNVLTNASTGKSEKTPLSEYSVFQMRDPRDVANAPRDPQLGYLYSYLLYRGFRHQRVKVSYCKTLAQAERIASRFLSCPVLGLDVEFKTGGGSRIIDKISLIQVSSDSEIALFHIALFKGDQPEHFMPPTLKRILQATEVYKTGSQVKGDASRIKTHLDCKVEGLIDLKQFLQSVHPDEKREKVNAKLSDRVLRYFGLPLNKNNSTRCSEWNKSLDEVQKEYAATDAYASLMVFHAIDAERRTKRLPPPHELLALNCRSSRKALPRPSTPSAQLMSSLKALRDRLVTETSKTNQQIMKNATMKLIASRLPETTLELGNIGSLPRFTVEKHGAEILQVVRDHVKRFRITRLAKSRQATLKEWIRSSESSNTTEITHERGSSYRRAMKKTKRTMLAKTSTAIRKLRK